MKKTLSYVLGLALAFGSAFAVSAQETPAPAAPAIITAVYTEDFSDVDQVETWWKLNKRYAVWEDGYFVVYNMGNATMKSRLPENFTLSVEITPFAPTDEEKAKEGWTGLIIGEIVFYFNPLFPNSSRTVYFDEDGKKRGCGVVKGGDLGELGIEKVTKYVITRTRDNENEVDKYTVLVNGVNCGKFEARFNPKPETDVLNLASFRWGSHYDKLVITPKSATAPETPVAPATPVAPEAK